MAKFVAYTGGRLIEVDTEAPVTQPDTSASYTVTATPAIGGLVSVGVAKCGCLTLIQIPLNYNGAIISEDSSKNPEDEDFYPIVSESGAFYVINEDNSMSSPKKITEFTQATVNNIVSNLDTADILISLDTGGGYESYKLNFEQLIDVIKTAIQTGVLEITMSGVSGTSVTLIDKNILDAELNEQNIPVLSSVPVSGEQGVYVNTSSGAYEVYNMGTDLTGAKLKLIYSNT